MKGPWWWKREGINTSSSLWSIRRHRENTRSYGVVPYLSTNGLLRLLTYLNIYHLPQNLIY